MYSSLNGFSNNKVRINEDMLVFIANELQVTTFYIELFIHDFLQFPVQDTCIDLEDSITTIEELPILCPITNWVTSA